MAKVSQRSAFKLAIQRNVESAMRNNIDELEGRIEEVIFREGVPDTLTVRDVLMALPLVLKRDYLEFEKYDHRVSLESAEDRVAREHRGEAIVDLRECIIDTRSIVEGFWGSRAVRFLTLTGETPRQPDSLVTYARNVEQKLSQGLDRFELRLNANPPSAEQLAAELDQRINTLAEALEAVEDDVRETQDAQQARNRAAEAWDDHYVPTATIVEHLFRLGGMPEHAERVRPTTRRRSGLAEEEDLKEIEDDPDVEIVDDVVDDVVEDPVVV